MKYLLFKKEKDTNRDILSDKKYTVEEIVPGLKLYFSKVVGKADIFWSMLALGNYRLYVVRNEQGEIIHKSTRIGKCIKFAFLTRNSYEIGPCYTKEEYRGQGIYPFVINHIMRQKPGCDYYMLVREDNQSSIKGVLKAGFKETGQVKKTLGIWRKC